MKHLLHLVRADVRRFRLLLGLWTLVVIAETVLRAVRPALAGDPQLSMMFDLLATALFATRWLGMVVIVALVVQTHPLVGSDAFWMTRPISWRVLLASKLVLLGTTFVAVPALCELVLMAACRVPMAEALPVTLQLVLFQCLWLFIVMALSSLTKNLARLALVAGSVMIGLILLLNLMIAVMMRRLDDGPQMVEVIPRTESSPIGGGGDVAADHRGVLHIDRGAIPHPIDTRVGPDWSCRHRRGIRSRFPLAFVGPAGGRAGLGQS